MKRDWRLHMGLLNNDYLWDWKWVEEAWQWRGLSYIFISIVWLSYNGKEYTNYLHYLKKKTNQKSIWLYIGNFFCLRNWLQSLNATVLIREFTRFLSSDCNTHIHYQENIFLIKKYVRNQIGEQKGDMLSMKSEHRKADVLEECFILAEVLTPMNYPIDPNTWASWHSLFFW